MSEKTAVSMNRFYLCLLIPMAVYIFFLQTKSCNQSKHLAENQQMIDELHQREQQTIQFIRQIYQKNKAHEQKIAALESDINELTMDRDRSKRETVRLKRQLTQEYPLADNCEDSLEICIDQSTIKDSIIQYQDQTISSDSAIISKKDEQLDLKDSIIDGQSDIIYRQDTDIQIYKHVVDKLNGQIKPRTQVFLAGNVGAGFDMSDKSISGFMAGPEVIIKDKKGFLYGAGASWCTTGDVYAHAKFGFLLRFKRR